MSKADFEKYMKRMAVRTVITLTVAASVTNATAREEKHGEENVLYEYPATFPCHRDDSDTKSLFGIAKLGTYEQGGKLYPTINGNIVRGNYERTLKKEQRMFRREQKQAFFQAPTNLVDTVKIEDFWKTSNLASYDEITKNIRFHYFETTDDVDKLYHIIRKKNPHLSEERIKTLVQLQQHISQALNNRNSLDFKCLNGHEQTHRNNDKMNLYAPGLSAEQYAILNQYDEISANVVHLLILEDAYKKRRQAGVTEEEALKIFESTYNGKFAFYKEALEQGLDCESETAKWLKVQGTCRMWIYKYRKQYYSQGKQAAMDRLGAYNIASLAMGNQVEFRKRIKKIFDNFDSNIQLRQLGIKVGRMSQYLPKKIISLEPCLYQKINKETLKYTGMTLEEGKRLSEALPGKPKKDAAKLLKLLSGRVTDYRTQKVMRQTKVSYGDVFKKKQYTK